MMRPFQIAFGMVCLLSNRVAVVGARRDKIAAVRNGVVESGAVSDERLSALRVGGVMPAGRRIVVVHEILYPLKEERARDDARRGSRNGAEHARSAPAARHWPRRHL